MGTVIAASGEDLAQLLQEPWLLQGFAAVLLFVLALILTRGLRRVARELERRKALADYVRGLENPTEASHNIVRWLVKHGYSDEDIAKVVGGNALRVLETAWR